MSTRTLLAIVLVALVAATMAYAADHQISGGTYQYPGTYPPDLSGTFVHNYNVTQFDPSMGTLQFITITYQGTWAGSMQFRNNDAITQDVTADQTFDITLVQGANSLFDIHEQTPGGLGGIDLGNTASGALSSLYSWGPTTVSTGSPKTVTGAGMIPWEGTGTVALTGAFSGQTNAYGPASYTAFVTGNGGEQFTITYDYTDNDVPEPGSLGLGALALLGLGGLRMRRGKKKQSS